MPPKNHNGGAPRSHKLTTASSVYSFYDGDDLRLDGLFFGLETPLVTFRLLRPEQSDRGGGGHFQGALLPIHGHPRHRAAVVQVGGLWDNPGCPAQTGRAVGSPVSDPARFNLRAIEPGRRLAIRRRTRPCRAMLGAPAAAIFHPLLPLGLTPRRSICGLPTPPGATSGFGRRKCFWPRRPDCLFLHCARHRWR